MSQAGLNAARKEGPHQVSVSRWDSLRNYLRSAGALWQAETVCAKLAVGVSPITVRWTVHHLCGQALPVWACRGFISSHFSQPDLR